MFDDYGVTDPKARLTETARGELHLKVEQLYYNFADSHDLTHRPVVGIKPSVPQPASATKPVGVHRAGNASLLITGSIARSANLPVFSLLRGQF